MNPVTTLHPEELRQLAHAAGLTVLSWTGISPLADAKRSLRLWQEEGFCADMGWMKRDPELLGEIEHLLPGARSVIVFAVAYDRSAPTEIPPGSGRIARYAWGQDYHLVLKERIGRLLQSLGPGVKGRVFSDAVPLMERALAARAGIGFVGKSSMLIRPRTGTYFFIAELITDLCIAGEVNRVAEGSCGSCQRCMDACPTQAIVREYTVDARKCISYLSIEKRGMLSVEERRALGSWVFGCDVCQEVCPFNHRALSSQAAPDCPEFSGSGFPGPWLNLKQTLAIRSEADFKKIFARTALLRTKREGLLRNAAVVAANTSVAALKPDLLSACKEDSSAVVRAHAAWALLCLDREQGILTVSERAQLLSLAAQDEDSLLQQ